MKKLFKKNQIMITALAIMLAVAGYLNFTGDSEDAAEVAMGMSQNEVSDMGEDVTALLDISDEDIAGGEYVEIESLDDDGMVMTEDYIDEEMAELLEASETLSADDELAASGEAVPETAGELTIEEEPGEAVYTSVTSVTSLASARLIKEQTRAQNRETLLAIINSTSADEASRMEATNCMIELTNIAEKETSAEILLEARGYTEVVVSITEDSADVVVGLNELSDAQCAQIIDIVSRKTDIPQENIIITPVTGN